MKNIARFVTVGMAALAATAYSYTVYDGGAVIIIR